MAEPLIDDLPFDYGAAEANPAAAARKCRHPRFMRLTSDPLSGLPLAEGTSLCGSCFAVIDGRAARRGRNNRKRGNAEELTVARKVGGRKMGPLGLPWDVEMKGYARLQVRKLQTPPSLRAIGASLTFGTGEEMAGYIWVEPGRGGEQLITFRLKDFALRHGIPEVEA